MEILRQAVIPVLSAYLVFVAILVAFRRSRHAGRRADRAPGAQTPAWRHLVGYLAAMAVGGYLFFVLIVVVFYFILGNEPGSLISQAFAEGSLLAFAMVVPAFLAMSWMADRARRRRDRRLSTGGPRDR